MSANPVDSVLIKDSDLSSCAIDAAAHIASSLGSPLTLPPILADKLSQDWAAESEDDLLALFKLITGKPYTQVCRENTYNCETDLSTYFVFTVYAPQNCSDWVWCYDSFIVIELGAGGDPRYSAYGPAQVYRLEDGCIGDTDFLTWTLGFYLRPISDRYNDEILERLNDRVCSGYSSHPYCELEPMLVDGRAYWSDRRQAHIARVDNVPYPVIIEPVIPCYG